MADPKTSERGEHGRGGGTRRRLVLEMKEEGGDKQEGSSKKRSRKDDAGDGVKKRKTAPPSSSREGGGGSRSLYVQFGSGVGPVLRQLSNFSDARFTYTWPEDINAVPGHMRGHTATYDTSEHAFQSLRSLNLETARAFETGGLFSGYGAFAKWPMLVREPRDPDAPLRSSSSLAAPMFHRVLRHEDRSSKAAYWTARQCSGIVPKMAVGLPPGVIKAAWGLDVGPPKPRVGLANHCPLWVPLLVAKYEQNPPHLHALYSATLEPQQVLVETSRYRKPSSYWTAFVEKPSAEHPAGRLIGHNIMGRIMGMVRDVFVLRMRDRIASFGREDEDEAV